METSVHGKGNALVVLGSLGKNTDKLKANIYCPRAEDKHWSILSNRSGAESERIWFMPLLHFKRLGPRELLGLSLPVGARLVEQAHWRPPVLGAGNKLRRPKCHVLWLAWSPQWKQRPLQCRRGVANHFFTFPPTTFSPKPLQSNFSCSWPIRPWKFNREGEEKRESGKGLSTPTLLLLSYFFCKWPLTISFDW